MRHALVFAIFCYSAAADDRIARLLNGELSSRERAEACYELRAETSGEAREAMRNVLAAPTLRACAGANLRRAEAVEQLQDALDDREPEVRALAARELGALARPEMMERLAQNARDPNLLVASSAIYALCQYKDARVLPHLLALARQGNMVGVMALARAADFADPAVLAVARALLCHQDVPVRLAALRVVGDLGDSSDLRVLKEMTADETVTSNGRGFGFMPAINVGRAARTAIELIEKREAVR